ncbi:hypothetical protein F3Y22_tig00018568pilonHSYRG00031 [Hibiscus syriacus]|uniref:Uncharacterized protein n=1 Tax=Hibiscus syriacus TaxID=106335 RepID=A0A6A3BVW8_HIBSY|nr:hypothetical protein F3Y22_tig00018568pilonHSYRG00031 [Hibiscus syriacus]
MGANAEFQVPVIEFRTSSLDLGRGTKGWHQLCKSVREACETYGCFQVVYEGISRKARDDTDTSLYEGYGIDEASNYDCVGSFAQLMWPHGHPHFCETIHTIVKQMEELNNMIWLLIIDSYGLGKKWESVMIDYKMLLLSTIICDDLVSGLEIEVGDGQWIKLSSSPSSFFFVVRDPLMAWSNGRMKAVNHRVTMSGDKDRFSIATFAMPVEGEIISTPKELVDEQHP